MRLFIILVALHLLNCYGLGLGDPMPWGYKIALVMAIVQDIQGMGGISVSVKNVIQKDGGDS